MRRMRGGNAPGSLTIIVTWLGGDQLQGLTQPLNLIHAEVPNRMIGTFPFMFIPGFFVPLAAVLHVLAIRTITSQARTAIDTP
jgi:hypothetical protein